MGGKYNIAIIPGDGVGRKLSRNVKSAKMCL